jgi:HK97 family phage portal protein
LQYRLLPQVGDVLDTVNMGLLGKLFGNKPAVQNTAGIVAPSFRTITESTPVFTSWSGDLYQQERTRAAIDRIATACSKLKPEVVGDSNSSIAKVIKTRPNGIMTWPSFLSRLATIYNIDDTAFVVPTFKRDMRTIDGFFPFKCEAAEVCEYKGEPWIIFHTATGESMAIELRYVCVLTKFQYESDIFGTRNCLDSTMNLINAQVQAQEAAIKNGATIRFIGSLTGMVQEKDMEDKRKRFVESNFNANNNGGILLYDSTFGKVEQIDPKSYVISDAEMERIEENVCTYFGMSKKVLQNDFSEDEWSAFYEGVVEPFAIRLGEALTNVCYSEVEQMHGKRIEFSSSRLQYASMASKRNMIRDMVDRGLMTINEGREVLQLPPVEGGDIRVIRGEYVDATNMSNLLSNTARQEGAPVRDNEPQDTDYDNDEVLKDSDNDSEQKEG